MSQIFKQGIILIYCIFRCAWKKTRKRFPNLFFPTKSHYRLTVDYKNSCSWLTVLEPNVLFCWCSPSTLNFNASCFLKSFSVYCGYEELFELPYTSCPLHLDWPFSSDLSNQQCSSARCVLLCTSLCVNSRDSCV